MKIQDAVSFFQMMQPSDCAKVQFEVSNPDPSFTQSLVNNILGSNYNGTLEDFTFTLTRDKLTLNFTTQDPPPPETLTGTGETAALE